ncbi:MAG: ATP synthase F1 subunit gamma [Chitinophagales bacterium]|nr:ATP synthase F1 subunit gamma [Chitinophagales bacterium]MDW8394085.1 ATP synthase F1 subunit gamma [Chitinophagales bacterium]
MPGQLKEVRNRIKSVQNTQQITKAMKMVAAAKLRRATDRIIQIRPYAAKLTDIMSNLVGDAGVSSPFARRSDPPRKVLVVVVTSDRGLAGAFNANIIRLARQHISERYARQLQSGQLTVMPVGRKAYDAFRRLNLPLHAEFVGLFQHLSFEHSQQASHWLMDAFRQEQFDAIDLVYAQFKNAATQIFTIEPYLPVVKSKGGAAATNYLFEPDQEQLLNRLIPQILNTRFFRVLLDSNASEHGARMTAMDKATENAQELLRELSIKYNRARQAAITTEITEIVSGAAALQG